ncbi:hypothetical protein [Amycolatopsis sp. NPDC003731]
MRAFRDQDFGDGQADAAAGSGDDRDRAVQSEVHRLDPLLAQPGTFDTCHAALTRARDSAYLLEFDSYARRYAELGIPAYRPQELEPVYPWSLAWRDGEQPESVRAFLDVARETAARHHWLHPERADGVPLWAPPEDLAVA